MNLYYLLSVIGSRSLNLLTAVVLSYLLTSKEFGQFSLVLTNALLLHLIASSWITNTLWRDASKAKAAQFPAVVAHAIHYSAPLVVIALAAAPLSFLFLQPSAAYLAFILLLAPLILCVELASVVLNADRQHRDYSLLSLFRGIFTFAIGVGLVLLGYDLFGALAGQLIGILLALLLLGSVRAIPKHASSGGIGWRDAAPQIRFGIVSALALNLYMLGNALCRNVVALSLGEAAAGHLSLAADMFYAPVALFATSLSLSSIPDLYQAHGDHTEQAVEEGRQQSAKFIVSNLAVALPYAVGGAVTASAIVRLVLSDSAAQFVAPIAGYAVVQGACFALFSTFTTLALTQGRIKLALALSLGALIAIATALLIASSHDSLLAYVRATTAVLLLLTICTLLLCRAAFGVRIQVGEIVRLVAATVVLFAAAWLSMMHLPPHWSLFPAILFGGGGFIVSALLMRSGIVSELIRLKKH